MDYFSSDSSPAVAGDDTSVISKSAVAEKMSVSRQSLYYQPKLPAKDLLLKQQIEAVLLEHRAYGHRRIALALGVNKKRVKRVMKLFNLKAKKLRKKPKIKNRKSTLKQRQNLFTGTVINKPDQAWVSDFTYLSYQNKFMYLATILDAFTREVISWNISVRHNADLICEALISALNKRDKSPQIFHSDQGSEYCSNHVGEILRSKNIKASMSAKSSPWQNGKQESFYQKFKFELEELNSYQSQGELIEAIAIQIHYYNHRRIHSALKMPPTIFYQRFKAAENSDAESENNLKKIRAPLHPSLQRGVQNNQISPKTNPPIDRSEIQNYE